MSDDALGTFRKVVAKKWGTQREAAAAIGISAAYLSDVLNGRRRLTAKLLRNVPQGGRIFFLQASEEWNESR